MRLSLALKCANGPTRHVSVRAEVVARRACLSLSQMVLGTTYVRVPVKKLLKLRNLTQIDTTYEWDVSRATALGLQLRVEPRQGLLGSMLNVWWHSLASVMPQYCLGSCSSASSGRAWWPRAARHPQGEAPASANPATASAARASRITLQSRRLRRL